LVIWGIFSRFGMLYHEESGNPCRHTRPLRQKRFSRWPMLNTRLEFRLNFYHQKKTLSKFTVNLKRWKEHSKKWTLSVSWSRSKIHETMLNTSTNLICKKTFQGPMLDFKNIFAEKKLQKIAFLTQNKAT
jgi:hypothetical protein